MKKWSKTYFLQPTKIKLAALALCSLNIFATPLLITDSVVLSREKSGVKSVIKNQEDFIVITGQGAKKVKNHDVSRSLRKLNDKQLTAFLNDGHGFIKADQFTNGDFKLDMHVRGNGGGALGAAVGVIGGKAAVYGVSYGLIHLVGICTGPFYPATVGALTGVLAAPIEAASTHAAAVCGLAGAVATGPV